MRSENLEHLRKKLIGEREYYLARGGMTSEVRTLYDVLITLIKQLEEAEEDERRMQSRVGAL